MVQHELAVYPIAPSGAIANWLACGVIATPLAHLGAVVAADGSPFADDGRWIVNYWAYHPASVDLKRKLYQHTAPFTWQPAEPPVLNGPAIDEQTWRYAVTEADDMIDFSRFNFAPALMRGWLYTQIHTQRALTLRADLLTIGPAQIWLNGAVAHQFDATFSYVTPLVVPVELNLTAGTNALYLHGMTYGWRETRLALGLRLHNQPDVRVHLPLGNVPAERWHAAEDGLNQIVLKQFAIPDPPGTLELSAAATEAVTVHAEVSIPITGSPWARFGWLDLPYAEADLTLAPGQAGPLPLTDDVLHAMASLPGENALTLTIRPADGTPLALHREIWASSNTFSHAPYGDYESRRREALQHLAAMQYDVFAAMAAVATGKADQIESGAVEIACQFMENRHDCADFYAVSLLALLYRYGDQPALLSADRERIDRAFRGFKFWIDEPGLDAMCYCTENHQILFHVTAYLAGQYWPQHGFANSGLTGQQQRDRADERIRSWILRRLRGGYAEWDSNAYLTLDIFAMLALAEFADDEALREMATTLLHKSFFMIAMQSFRGAHGSTHGRCYVGALKTARAENSSNIQRIAWGMGIFNGETRATGLLALAHRYHVPDILQRIGADVDRTVTTRARSRETFQPEYDMHDGEWDIRTITRRTADYMLAAAVDHRPGEMGVQEHLWQATLSPEAVVFTTMPGNSQEHGQARPNFWSGSARLPRVAMIDQTVLCLYDLAPEVDTPFLQTGAHVGLGYSHAYFPTVMFDEWHIDGQWVFARYGSGYIALWGDGDLTLTGSGRHAGQEIRSGGRSAAWLCHLGRAADDGDFATFCQRVQQHQPQAAATTITWTRPDGKMLEWAWTGPLRVDSAAESWDDFPHYENTYTSTPMNTSIMTITYADQSLVLDLETGQVMQQA